jgi:hypothetical protein
VVVELHKVVTARTLGSLVGSGSYFLVLAASAGTNPVVAARGQDHGIGCVCHSHVVLLLSFFVMCNVSCFDMRAYDLLLDSVLWYGV